MWHVLKTHKKIVSHTKFTARYVFRNTICENERHVAGGRKRYDQGMFYITKLSKS